MKQQLHVSHCNIHTTHNGDPGGIFQNEGKLHQASADHR
jgi:hypothetical protein